MTGHNTGPGRRAPLGRNFFNWVRSLGVRRGDSRWVGGVCSGIARRVGWDPLLVRIIWFATLFVGGVGLAAYGFAWLLLPDERDGTIPMEELTLGRCTGSFVMAAIFVVVGLPVTTGTLPVLAVVLVGALLFAVVAGSRGDASWASSGMPADSAGQSYAQRPGGTGAQAPQSNPWPSPQATSSAQGATMYANNPYANNPYNQQPGDPRGPYGNPYAYQPYAQRPVPPAQPAEVRKPAGPAITGAMYGLTLIALAIAVMWQMIAPRDYATGSTGAQMWVLGVTAVTGVVLIALGAVGRRTGGLMPLAVIGLVLSLMVAGGAQVRVSISGARMVANGTGSELTFSDARYSSQDYLTYGLGSKGLELTFSDATLDLSDWQQATGEPCPTGTLYTNGTFSDLTIVLPEGCGYDSSDLSSTFGSVIGQGVAGAGRVGDSYSADPSRTLTLTGDVTFGSVTIRPAGSDSSGSSGSSLDSSDDPSSPMNS